MYACRARRSALLLSIRSTHYTHTPDPYYYCYYSVNVWVLYLICKTTVSGYHLLTCHLRLQPLFARARWKQSVLRSGTNGLVGEIYVRLPMKHCCTILHTLSGVVRFKVFASCSRYRENRTIVFFSPHFQKSRVRDPRELKINNDNIHILFAGCRSMLSIKKLKKKKGIKTFFRPL